MKQTLVCKLVTGETYTRDLEGVAFADARNDVFHNGWSVSPSHWKAPSQIESCSLVVTMDPAA